MITFTENNNQDFQNFITTTETVVKNITNYAKADEITSLNKLIDNFKLKTDDFYRENRKLNIGVIGQVKAGKSSFLNTLLFGGKEILPKASTPKTATLTKMEYAEENVIQIEYYSEYDWERIVEDANIDVDEDIFNSAREIMSMVKKNGINPQDYTKKETERFEFATYDDLISNLNDYVGEDGKYTPVVKAVTLYLNNEEFKGLSIVDTPGLNDPIPSRTQRTREFMEVCDVVFFLSQAGSFLDKSDWDLLSAQLPQKGVKKLVLIASKYDSGIRDILRVQDEDDIFGEDENTADNIPKACKIIEKKLRKRAKSKVAEFTKSLETINSTSELIEVIKGCSEPIMISSIAYNMANKPEEEYSSEEKNICSALKVFSKDIKADLKLLGNFDKVNSLFEGVIDEKEAIFEAKSKSFVPNAMQELKSLLTAYIDKSAKRVQVLENNDREKLLEQKRIIEEQMKSIRGDISTVLGELNIKLEEEKINGIRDIRDSSKEYLSIKERSGTITRTGSYSVSDSKWYNPFSWGSSHTEYYTYEEHYSYWMAADAIENLNKHGIEASGKVEEVFSEALQLKELKRRLLNVVVNNFDLGSEKYDSSLFRIMVEETISRIEFPVFKIDISDELKGISGKFSGEITSPDKKNELIKALSSALSKINEALCSNLEEEVKKFKAEMKDIGKKVEDSLLTNINEEFEELLSKFENKDKEIADYKTYIALLETETGKLE